jgi:HK97 family phage portal protein
MPNFNQITQRLSGDEAPAEVRSASVWSDAMSWGALVPGRLSGSGIAVSPETAMQFPAAYAAVNVIATDLASLPIKVYKKREGVAGRDRVTNDPRAELLGVSPDGETTPSRWKAALYGHMLRWGNAFAEIVFDLDGWPTALHLLDPRTTQPQRVEGRLTYRTGSTTLPPYRVLHLAGLGFDGLSGYPTTQVVAEAIGLGLAAQTSASNYFANGSEPGGVIEVPQKLGADGRKNLVAGWEMRHQGAGGRHRVAVLEQGAKYNQTSTDPDKAQVLESRKFQVMEAVRQWRVPPNKVGDFSNAHLANIEAANLDYVITVIMPWAVSVEQELNLKLFTADERRAGWYVEHDLRALLRGDMKSRAEFYTKLRDLGVLSPNDICELENLNPIGPDGDTRLVPLNMVSLAQAGQPASEPAAAAQASGRFAVPGVNGHAN